MPCRERSRISTPSSCSMDLIRLDSADWVIYSLSAAWVMLRVSSSASSSSKSFSSIEGLLSFRSRSFPAFPALSCGLPSRLSFRSFILPWDIAKEKPHFCRVFPAAPFQIGLESCFSQKIGMFPGTLTESRGMYPRFCFRLLHNAKKSSCPPIAGKQLLLWDHLRCGIIPPPSAALPAARASSASSRS